MADSLLNRMKQDWERQPAAIFAQCISIGLAIGLAAWGSVVPPSGGGFKYSASSASIPLALLVTGASVTATLCRPIFRKTVVGGFSIALVLASACMLIFAQIAAEPLVKSTRYVNGSYNGSLLDIAYWTVFLIYIAVCSQPATERIAATWGKTKSEDGKEHGVSLAELSVFALAWGWCLSGAQQRIIGAFVVQQIG
ncbi:hypothetical protein [Sphingomonas sp. SAFR-052]|uniref:hypothetical protein n=1 Tax=Sphingomonas sp. SAFR-052 TaxID=3436867 RepID=UPI003F7E2255